MPTTALDTLRFGEPQLLWLLVAPGVLLALWGWRLASRMHDRRAFRQHRLLPARERLTFAGGLFAWLALIAATALLVVALARPVATVPLLRPAGVDLVILQDGSASMRVRDVSGDRWQRSVVFLRALGESLRWEDDRIALALFAHVAEPQIRLTRDPNVFFFFLDHLDEEPPFRLEDDTTWDTNIELGLYWGIRLISRDQEMNGQSPNAKVFVLVSDGQAWSGAVAQAIALARARNVPIYVVGVGTATGGAIPEPPKPINIYAPPPPPPIHSRLDRESLMTIATAGEGEYFELNRQSDREIANRIVNAAQRNAGVRGVESTTRDLYWPCLLAAAVLLGIGVIFVQGRVELWLQALGSAVAVYVIWIVARS
jgi:Ca-activated chloride channel family protein